MIFPPPELKKAPKFRELLKWLNAIRAFSIASAPKAGLYCDVHQGADGSLIDPIIPCANPGGSAPAPNPFQLLVTTDPADTSPTPAPKIRVIPSTLTGGSSTDLGFSPGDNPKYFLDPSEGVLVGGISWDPTTGEITTRWLEIKSTFPTSDEVPDGTDYVEIGTVHWVADDSDAGGHWTASNSRYGPINATICRNWFASEAPYFGCSWS